MVTFAIGSVCPSQIYYPFFFAKNNKPVLLPPVCHTLCRVEQHRLAAQHHALSVSPQAQTDTPALASCLEAERVRQPSLAGN